MVRVRDFVSVEVQEALYSIARNNTQVVVTHHAVKRFLDWRRRGSDASFSEEEAEEFLTRIAREGKRTRHLPGGAYEVKFQGMHAVVKTTRDGLVVLTFNGDKEWSWWWRRQRKREKFSAKILAAL